MSVICAAIKDKEVAIACDTQSNFGSLCVPSRHHVNSGKLYSVNGSIIGIVGWHAISNMIEHLIKYNKKEFVLNDRMSILTTLITLHEKMKDDYYLETREDEDQPVESNQLDALIINKHGLFQIGTYREVNEFKTFWAIGSGNKLGIGAMHAVYNSGYTAREIAETGVKAAAEFDDGCGLPLKSKSIKLKI